MFVWYTWNYYILIPDEFEGTKNPSTFGNSYKVVTDGAVVSCIRWLFITITVKNKKLNKSDNEYVFTLI
jgi:hypothetical protein